MGTRQQLINVQPRIQRVGQSARRHRGVRWCFEDLDNAYFAAAIAKEPILL